jgi:S-adenosylmethionine:tRNA ribosyltransferase-isomerase
MNIAELGAGGPVRLEVIEGDLRETLDAMGRMPLPPYIRRPLESADSDAVDRLDRERYQTVVAANEGAVAAPTAGLHFTQPILHDLESQGVDHVTVTLHVGYGSFQPIRSQRIEDHALRAERFEIGGVAAQRINDQRAAGRRVVAVGTTVVRTLESAVDEDGRVSPQRGSTALMILPGHTFRIIDALLTNFHHPRTTLFALALAFGGVDRIRRAYTHALASGFRFLSYGDAMLIA